MVVPASCFKQLFASRLRLDTQKAAALLMAEMTDVNVKNGKGQTAASLRWTWQWKRAV